MISGDFQQQHNRNGGLNKSREAPDVFKDTFGVDTQEREGTLEQLVLVVTIVPAGPVRYESLRLVIAANAPMIPAFFFCTNDG